MSTAYKILYTILYPIYNALYWPHYIGKENFPEGACIVCANHSSMCDPFWVAFALGRKDSLHFMAKKELFKIPILNWILKKAGVFGIDRGNADVEAIKTAIKYLKNGEKIMMFPEGTRISSDDKAAAKTGAIMLASRTEVPIVPCYIPRKKRLFSRMKIVVGKPYKIARVRGTSEAYSQYDDELMEKIIALSQEEEAK